MGTSDKKVKTTVTHPFTTKLSEAATASSMVVAASIL